MGVDEASRHRFRASIAKVHGEEVADTLMEHMPPGGWTVLATKEDLIRLEGGLDSLEARLEARLEAKMLKIALMVNVPSILGAVGLAFAATRLG